MSKDLADRMAASTAGLQRSIDNVMHEAAERQATLAALRQSEERFRLLAENATDLISKHTPDGLFTYASPSARAVLGFEPEELMTINVVDLIHPDDREAAVQEMRTGLRSPEMRLTCRIRRKDGTYAWVESTDRPIRDPETHRLIEVQSVTRDVTDRKLAEEALRESEARFRNIFESSSVGIAIIGPDLRVRRANRAAADMLRYTEDDLDGAAVSSLIAAPEGERDEALRLLSEAAAPSSFETRFVRRNGDQFWAAVEVAPISGEDGKTHETLAVILDISERKRTEDEGRDLATLKSDFLALASHELRAPLTNINGGLEVMAPDVENLGGSTSRAFEIVSNEARRLTRLVESVLDISRLDAGQLPLVLGAVAVDPLLARAICGTEFAERTRTSIQPRLPLIWADEVYLEQVLRNVISNATKYASGMIDVQARLDGDRVLICVTDAGPGIAPEEQQQIFEPFFRGAQRTDRDGGYGLGLYFARRLVEAQGGSIMVQSPVGADPLRPGTRFCISMPLAPEVT